MITTTLNDILLVGHGSYDVGSMSPPTVALPEGVELWVLPPAGYTLQVNTLRALIQMVPIDRLLAKKAGLQDETGIIDAHDMATVYKGRAPNLTLTPLDEDADLVQFLIDVVPNTPYIFRLPEHQKAATLQQLLLHNASVQGWLRDEILHNSRNPVRLFWSACARDLTEETQPELYVNGLAAALKARAFSRTHPADQNALMAANAAQAAARATPLDTQAVLAAVTTHDPDPSHQLLPVLGEVPGLRSKMRRAYSPGSPTLPYQSMT